MHERFIFPPQQEIQNALKEDHIESACSKELRKLMVAMGVLSTESFLRISDSMHGIGCLTNLLIKCIGKVIYSTLAGLLTWDFFPFNEGDWQHRLRGQHTIHCSRPQQYGEHLLGH